MNGGLKAFVPAILLAFAGIIVIVYASGYPQVLPAGEFGLFLFKAYISKFLFVALLLLAAYGAGGAAFGRVLPGFTGLLEEFLFKSAAGLAVLSYSVFLVALIGLVYPATGFLIIAAALAAGYREIHRLFRRLPGSWPAFRPSAFSVILLGISFYFLLLGLLGALLPPTGFDVLMYHFGVPKLYLSAHRMFPTPDINGSSFPFGGEMLYLLGMMVDGPVAANLVNYSFAVLGGLAAAAFTRRFLPGAASLASFAIYVCVPLVIWLMPQAYIELAMGFYSMLAIHAAIAGLTGNEKRWLLLAAVMAGFTVALKYTGVILVGVLFLAVVVHFALAERRGKEGAKAGAVFLSIALLACLPWFVRNLIYYSNPVYPFLAKTFNGVNHAVTEMEGYSGLTEGGPVATAYRLVSSFWNTTLDSGLYKVGWDSGFGPYFLMLIPGLVFFRGTPRAFKYLLLITPLFFILLIFGLQGNIRYMTPIIPALAVLAGYPLGRLASGGDAAPGLTPRLGGILLAALFAFSALAANTSRESALANPSSGPAGEDAYYSDFSEKAGYLASYPAWQR